jgi:transcriptional regulator with XRE-family HTH domain
MIIGDRMRELREQQQLSQGDVEKRTGLLRSYISRVENGHTVPGGRDAREAGAGAGDPGRLFNCSRLPE